MVSRAGTHLAHLAVLLALPAVLALGHFLVVRPETRTATPQLTVEQALSIPNLLWIDARARDRYEAGHIPGALLLNQQEWESHLEHIVEEWSSDHPIVVYCDGRGCEDSRAVADRLRRDLAAEKIYTLRGGYAAWREAGRPVQAKADPP